MNLICATCTKEYKGVVNGKRTFCSRKCQGLGRRKQKTILCEPCGKRFTFQTWRLKRGNVFCSKPCSFLGRRKRSTINCLVCKKEVTDSIGDDRKFCSKKCFYIFNRNERHYLWKERPSYRTIHHWVATAFGKASKCEECGMKSLPEGMKRYFDWANISGNYLRIHDDWKQLCKKCHKAFDGKRHK